MASTGREDTWRPAAIEEGETAVTSQATTTSDSNSKPIQTTGEVRERERNGIY